MENNKSKYIIQRGLIWYHTKDFSDKLNHKDYKIIEEFMKDCKIPEGEGHKQILEGMVLYFKNKVPYNLYFKIKK